MSMPEAKRSIFRPQALQHYAQSGEKVILPRIVAPPVFLLMWMLLGLCITAIIVSWFSQIPIYAPGTGVVLERTIPQRTQPAQELIALIFLPTDPAHPLHISAGSPVLLRIGARGQQLSTTIDTVESGVLSPGDAQKRYALGSMVAQVITGPSIAISVKLGPAFQVQAYVGSSINAQVQVSSRSVLSLLPGLGTLIGE